MPAFSQSFLTASLVQGGSDAAKDAEIWHVARSALRPVPHPLPL